MSNNDWMPGVHHHDLSRHRGNGRFNKLHPMLGVALHVNDAYPGTPISYYVNGGGPNEVCPNFQLPLTGAPTQLLPGPWRPWCQRNGNDSYVAIETAGKPGQPLTKSQLIWLGRILAWYHQHHGLQLKLANRPGQRGLGTHAMGKGPWGGHTSCPGSIRSGQRRAALALAAKYVKQSTGAKPVRKPAPTPAQTRSLSDAQLRHELALTDHQLANGRGIIAAARAHPKFKADPRRAATIAAETALDESGMRVLASANVPASVNYPHDRISWTSDGLGHDHASCGMYQQQTGTKYARRGTSTMGSAIGWGTPATLMNPQKSTALFLDHLAKVRWRTLPRWKAAQAVQRSAFADGRNYRKQDPQAIKIVTALWPAAAAKPAAPARPAAPAKPAAPRRPAKPQPHYRTVTVRSGDSLSTIAKHNHVPGGWRALYRLNKAHLAGPNKIRPGQQLRVPA